MQKSITSKALSLLLALMMSLGIFSAIQVASPTASAKTVGGYDINFATSGNTVTENGITFTAEIGNSVYTRTHRPTGQLRSYVDVSIDCSGTASDAGMLEIELEHGFGTYVFDTIYVPQGRASWPSIPYSVSVGLPTSPTAINDLQLVVNFTQEDVYRLNGVNSATTNNQTLTVDLGYANSFFPGSPLGGKFVGENAVICPYIDVTGSPLVAGNYSVTLSSSKINYNQIVTLPADPDYSHELDDFTMPAYDVDDLTLSVVFTPTTNSTSNSSSSKSSSSSNNRSSYTPPSTPAPSPVNQTQAVQNVKDAIAAAKNSPDGATVNLKNVSTVSLATLREMAKAAGNTALKVSADSLSANGSVDVRITLDPSKAAKEMNLSASTTSREAQVTGMTFAKHFSNNVSVVSLSQKGDFGMPVRVAAKVDKKLNAETLIFYSYNSETNSYTQIKDPQYKVDKNGYVHFTTEMGGEIVISDKPLKKK